MHALGSSVQTIPTLGLVEPAVSVREERRGTGPLHLAGLLEDVVHYQRLFDPLEREGRC